jgi:hypothetical protein
MTRPASNRAPAANSFFPRPIVSSLIPVTRATAATPPYPNARASDAAHNRR